METTNKKVVETTNTEGKKPVDKRVIYLITKPYKFAGEEKARSEIIELTPVSDQHFVKTFSKYPKTGELPRRQKTIRVDEIKFPNNKVMPNVTAYFDHLLKYNGYSVATTK